MHASSDPAASVPAPFSESAESRIGQLAAEQTTTIRLTGVMVLLAVVLVAMAGLLWVDWFTDTQEIHYVAVGTGIGMSRPGEVPPGAAEAFAQAVTLHMGNVTPATVESIYADIERYLHPHFVPQFKARARREIAYVKANHIASLVSVRGVHIETDDQEKRLNRAKVDAVRRVYVGESMVREEVIEVPVAFFPAAVTSLNIYGLVILELQFPQLGRPLEPRDAAGLHKGRN